jgi:hypothetical protein
MAAKSIGSRVTIKSGMREFIGQVGTIIDNTERDGRVPMYRVRFDNPVKVAGVGEVRDDLWAGSHLSRSR